MAAIGNGAALAKGRYFAAWLGLGAEANVDGRSDDPRSHQLKDALHRSQAHADRLRRPPACPMLASRGGGPKCQVNHPLHGDCRQRRLSCRGSGRQCLPR